MSILDVSVPGEYIGTFSYTPRNELMVPFFLVGTSFLYAVNKDSGRRFLARAFETEPVTLYSLHSFFW